MWLSSDTRAIPEVKNLQKVLSSFWEIVTSKIQELYKLEYFVIMWLGII